MVQRPTQPRVGLQVRRAALDRAVDKAEIANDLGRAASDVVAPMAPARRIAYSCAP